MSSKLPTVRKISWIALIPQLVFMVLLFGILYLLRVWEPLIVGSLIYVTLSFGLKMVLARDHRTGMRLYHQQKFADAIASFEKSLAFFSEHAWIDKFRALTLLSASRMSYREMALCNIAFCYSQLGERTKSVEYYERALREFPENTMASMALKMLGSEN